MIAQSGSPAMQRPWLVSFTLRLSLLFLFLLVILVAIKIRVNL
jgi:hypothetical protein